MALQIVIELSQSVLNLQIYHFIGYHLTTSAQYTTVRTIKYCPDTYYFFRCNITGARQIWKRNGIEVYRFVVNTVVSDITPEEPLNILLQQKIRGTREDETNFVSYLWFNSSNLNDTENISCDNDAEIFEEISFKPFGKDKSLSEL